MYKGQLKGFPQEVVEKMLERQVEQGNKRDVSVFECNFYSSKKNGGFDWDKTIEKDGFWTDVIHRKNFSRFFEKYPRQAITNETSKEAYATLDVSALTQKIINHFESVGYGTQDSVAEALNLERNQVHKRLSEIEKSGFICETNIAIRSPKTGKLCKVWALKGTKTITLNVGI